jgi:hypothetical protein
MLLLPSVRIYDLVSIIIVEMAKFAKNFILLCAEMKLTNLFSYLWSNLTLILVVACPSLKSQLN